VRGEVEIKDEFPGDAGVGGEDIESFWFAFKSFFINSQRFIWREKICWNLQENRLFGEGIGVVVILLGEL
jgi:hypothetical protein